MAKGKVATDGAGGAAAGDVAAARTIADHTIDDLASFKAATTNGYELGGVYFFSILDCLVELAYAVANDFVRRPQLYTKLADDAAAEDAAAALIAFLRAQYGTNELVPSKEDRKKIFTPLFGSNQYASNGRSDFERVRNDLVAAATAFSERVFDTGEAMLRDRVRAAHKPFKVYLQRVEGAALRFSRTTTLQHVTEELAYPILRNAGVAGVFGVVTSAGANWPYIEDANGEKLTEEIAKEPIWDGAASPLTGEHFSNLQRAAVSGAEAIATIIDLPAGSQNDDDLDLLITKVYTWGAALGDVLQSTEGEPDSSSMALALPAQP